MATLTKILIHRTQFLLLGFFFVSLSLIFFKFSTNKRFLSKNYKIIKMVHLFKHIHN